MAEYRFMGYCVSPALALRHNLPMRENTEVPEALIRELYDECVRGLGDEVMPDWAGFCEEIADPHGSITTIDGDFWAERVA